MLLPEGDPDRQMDIAFSLLDGTTAVVSTSTAVTLGALRKEVAVALGLIGDSAALPPPFLMTLVTAENDSADHATAVGQLLDIDSGTVLHDGSFASEAADGTILVVLTPEPEDCRNKRFMYRYFRGRHCGQEEDEETVTLDLNAGGVFAYQRYDHSHDAESSYWYDRWQKATGQWVFRGDSNEDDAGMIILTGEVEESVRQRGKKDSTSRKKFRTSFQRKELLGKASSRGKWTSEQLP
eukprot:TRINITY_DN2991_c0_g2_i1.p1 TRINITY_DN2991_c0_g2~~TRINITY_DN2991_c0_g2_i1.p1  ORF type:complete len:265 (+),score=31.36 TRINITY_DN2991_c0_g2_i1:83-796(+)